MNRFVIVLLYLISFGVFSETVYAAQNDNECLNIAKLTPLEEFERLKPSEGWNIGDYLRLNAQPVRMIVKDLRSATGFRIVDGQIREVSYLGTKTASVKDYLGGFKGHELRFAKWQVTHSPDGTNLGLTAKSTASKPDYRIDVLEPDGTLVSVKSSNVFGAKFFEKLD